MNCPGSVAATRGMKSQSEYAAEGTAAHELSKWVRETGKPAKDWKGTMLVVGDFQFKVGKPMIDSVTYFVDDCAKLGGEPLVEELVSYDEIVPGGFGTLDDGRLKEGICTVTDLKHGTGVKVFAKENSQLRLYALGVYFKYRWLYEFDRFILRICQPRLKHFESEEIEAIETVRPWGVLQVSVALRVRPVHSEDLSTTFEALRVRRDFARGLTSMGFRYRPPRRKDDHPAECAVCRGTRGASSAS